MTAKQAYSIWAQQQLDQSTGVHPALRIGRHRCLMHAWDLGHSTYGEALSIQRWVLSLDMHSRMQFQHIPFWLCQVYEANPTNT